MAVVLWPKRRSTPKSIDIAAHLFGFAQPVPLSEGVRGFAPLSLCEGERAGVRVGATWHKPWLSGIVACPK
jgi:hypothetical protein